MTRILSLLIAALCGAIIAIAFAPRRYVALESKLPDNLFEVQSLAMANDKARQVIQAQADEIKRMRAWAVLNGTVKQ